MFTTSTSKLPRLAWRSGGPDVCVCVCVGALWGRATQKFTQNAVNDYRFYMPNCRRISVSVCVYLLIDTMRLNCGDNRSTSSVAAAAIIECVFGIFIDNLISDLFAFLAIK